MQLSLIEGALAGIGLFLLGMRIMSEGIRTVADDRIRGVLTAFTSNRFFSLLFGAAMSLLLNSASAAVIFTIGLANGGVLTTFQVINVLGGVLLGATMTLHLPPFPYSLVAAPLVFIGVIFKFFARRRRLANAGDLLLGSGLLFLGLTLLEGSFKPFDTHPFYVLISDVFFRYPYFAMLFGGMISCFVQSSLSAATIITALATSQQLGSAIAGSMVLGGFLGIAAITGLASVGGTSVSRRIAAFFIIITIVVILPLIAFIPAMLDTLDHLPMITAAHSVPHVFHQLTWIHTVAGLVIAVLTTVLSGLFSRMPGAMKGYSGNGATQQPCADYLDTRILNTPTLALEQARKEIVRMMSVTLYMYADVRELLFDFDARRAETIRQHEQVLDSLNHEITGFLAALAKASSNPEVRYAIPGMLQTVTDLEHIGDRCEDILDIIIERKEAGVMFSDCAMDDLKRLADVVSNLINSTGELFNNGEIPNDEEFHGIKKIVRKVFEEIKLSHFERISQGVCTPRATILFTEFTTEFNRISELCWNLMTLLGRKLL